MIFLLSYGAFVPENNDRDLHIVKLESSLTVPSKSVGLGVDTKMTVQTPPHLPHHTNST